jgi:hypothetical protein
MTTTTKAGNKKTLTIKYASGATGKSYMFAAPAAKELERAISAARSAGDNQAIWAEDGSNGNRFYLVRNHLGKPDLNMNPAAQSIA